MPTIAATICPGDPSRMHLTGGVKPGEEIQQFYNTLPNIRRPRMNPITFQPEKCGKCRQAGLWNCQPTPAAAWRILHEAPGGALADDDVRNLAVRHVPEPNAGNALTRTDEPPLRAFDSWRHQKQGYWFAMSREAALLDFDMGIGKSKIAVDVVVNRHAKRTLICCPVSVRGVWRREFAKWAPEWNAEILVVDQRSWTSARKAAWVDEQVKLLGLLGRPVVVVVNYETAWRQEMADVLTGIEWDVVIGDESHRFKNPESNTAEFMYAVREHAKFRLCLTGTPFAHSWLDVFGQMMFLDPGVFGTIYGAFRDRYSVTTDNGFGKVVVDKRNDEEFTRRLSHVVLHRGLDDTDIELPPIRDERVEVELEQKAQDVYEQLEDELMAEIEAGTVTAKNAMVKLLRLQQVTSGHVPLDAEFGNPESAGRIEMVGHEKQKALAELLSEIAAHERVVVFSRFTEDLTRAREVAEEMGREYGEVSGNAKDLTEHAQIPERVNVLGVQIRSGGTGVDFTAARYGIYYSMGLSLADYLQSRKRLWRPGQERNVMLYHLVATGTVDVRVYGAMARRQRVIESVVEQLKNHESC